MPPRLPRQVLLQCAPRSRLLRLAERPSARWLSASTPNHSGTPAAGMGQLSLPPDYVPAKQPPSARRPEKRQAQVIRSYTSLLRSTPLMLFFQHNNLTAVEWNAVRRELQRALSAVSPPPSTPEANGREQDLALNIRLQAITVRWFNIALKIAEFFDPLAAARLPTTQRTTLHGPLVHDLSSVAYETIKTVEIPPSSCFAQLEPVLTGPMAALNFPTVSPAHLAAALSILSPSRSFPAPTRRKVPSYHDPIAQSGLAKIFLVGGRVEGRVFDADGVNWLGGIQGGMDGLRAQLVSVLQGAGLSVSSTLESAGKSLWVSLESRRISMEEAETKQEDKSETTPEDKSHVE